MQHPRPQTYYQPDMDPITVRGTQIKVYGGEVMLDGTVDQVIQSMLEASEGLEDTWFILADYEEGCNPVYSVFGWREMEQEQLEVVEKCKIETASREQEEKQRREDYDRATYLRLKSRFEPEPKPEPAKTERVLHKKALELDELVKKYPSLPTPSGYRRSIFNNIT